MKIYKILHSNEILKHICFLFVFAKSDDTSTLIDFSAPVLKVFWSFIMIFFYCELGETVSDQFVEFDDELCQCNWYLYPMEIQKMLLIFMCEAQQLTLFRGYANIECTRDSFKNVSFFL